MKRKTFILVIAVTGIFGCFYFIHNIREFQQADAIYAEIDCRDSKTCSINCTVCAKEFCLDVNSAGVCDSPDIQNGIQSYFLSLKLDKFSIVQIRCNDVLVTAKIDVTDRKEFVSKEQSKQFKIHVCRNDIWATFIKGDLQQRNVESTSVIKTNIKKEFRTDPNPDVKNIYNKFALVSNNLDSVHPQNEGTNDQNVQIPYDNNGQLQTGATYPETYANKLQTNQQWVPGEITMRQYSSFNDKIGINKQLQKTFERIAEKNVWKAPNETRSGKGSLLESTVTIRECLGEWIKKYNITSIVDIPCGDGNWQRFIPGIDKVSYRGFDISTFVIKIAQNRNPPNMKYGILDLTSNIPPKADLIIMRDVIQHLPLRLGIQAILNAKKSGVKWIGVSSYPSEVWNRDIDMGEYYRNNVEISPFFLTNVVEMCDNYSGYIKNSHADSKFLLIENKDFNSY